MSTPQPHSQPLSIQTQTRQTLTRFDSPSSQSTTTSLLTPIDPNASFDQASSIGSGSGSGRSKKVFRVYQSKSIGNLRNRVVDDKMRSVGRPGMGDRALTSSDTESATPATHATHSTQPIHIQSTTTTRPRPTRSGSSLSSFIRKLTGRSASPPKSTSDPTPLYSTTSTRITRRPSLQHLNTNLPSSSTVPKSAPPMRGAIPFSPAGLTPEIPRQVDPVTVPLPPSPMSTYANLPDMIQPVMGSPLSILSGPSLKEIKQVGALSLGGVGSGLGNEGTQEDEEEEEVEEVMGEGYTSSQLRGRTTGDGNQDSEMEEGYEEEEDTFQPLRPIHIPVSTGSGRTRSLSPSTPITATITTPTSPLEDRRFAGSSPPRKAPVGTGAGLVRKESKWRKSVYGLSETLNNGVSRKNSTKPPPTSFDSYAAHQQRIAKHRVSCAPTLHSTASIAAEIREIKDKEQVDVIETFFMS